MNWGTGEIQFYPGASGDNAYLENGMLVLEAQYESIGGKSYTSARLHTHGSQSFQYGKIEARIKQPTKDGVKDAGIFPAFWMLGDVFNGWGHGSYGGTTTWPQSGEIDIMEYSGKFNINDNTSSGALHWSTSTCTYIAGGGGPTHCYTSDETASATDLFSEFHIYGILRTEDSITWYVDDTPFNTVDISDSQFDSFRKPFFVLLNFAVGGSLGGNPTPANYPQKMYVDWVRYYTCDEGDCEGISTPPEPEPENPSACPTGTTYYVYGDCKASDIPNTFQHFGGYENSMNADAQTGGGALGGGNYLQLTGSNAQLWAAGGWSRNDGTATIDLSIYGSAHFSVRRGASGPTQISAKLESHNQGDGIGKEVSRSLASNTDWQPLCIPLTDFTSGTDAVTLTNLRTAFVYVLQSPTDTIDIDEIYFHTDTACN